MGSQGWTALVEEDGTSRGNEARQTGVGGAKECHLWKGLDLNEPALHPFPSPPALC